MAGTFDAKDLDEKEMASKMVGKPVSFDKRSFDRFTQQKELLKLDSIKFITDNKELDLNFTLHQGEILGIAKKN
jgi:ABC-type uncharacterized transport system ATPase subunit